MWIESFLALEKKTSLMEIVHCMKPWFLLCLVGWMTNVTSDPSEYLELHKSQPVVVNGLEFIAITQAKWFVYNPEGMTHAIEVQLLITNHRKKDVIFPVFDTFQLILRNATGSEVPNHGETDGTIRTPPVLIHPGDTYCLCRKAELHWNYPDDQSHPHTNSFYYWDGTGSTSYFRPLALGHYTLSFGIGISEKDATTDKKDLRGLPVWFGEAITKEVPFEIVVLK